jgi:ABC-2 type transport system ATP-binding protein
MIISKGKLVASDSPEGLQKMMSGSPELEVLIKGDTDKVKSVLGNVSGVASVSDNASEETKDDAECRKYRIVADSDIDLRESIFYACADNHLPIMGMTYNRKSLEDIFLELTGGDQPEEEKVKTGLFGRRHSAAKSVGEADSDTKDNAENAASDTASESETGAEAESGTVNKEEEE